MYYSVTSSLAKNISSQGTYIRSSSISIKYLNDSRYRYSAVISKKQGPAVERNKVKRVIRELMRLKKGIYSNGSFLIYYNVKCADFNRGQVDCELDDIMKKIAKNKPTNIYT